MALEAIQGQKTANAIASESGVHPTHIAQWIKQALDELPQLFAKARTREKTDEALIAAL